MSSALYRRINELVEEVRSLKRTIVRKDALLKAACVHNRNIVDENARLINENSSLKFAAAARDARDIIDAQPVPMKGRKMYPPTAHPTMQLSGAVAE